MLLCMERRIRGEHAKHFGALLWKGSTWQEKWSLVAFVQLVQEINDSVGRKFRTRRSFSLQKQSKAFAVITPIQVAHRFADWVDFCMERLASKMVLWSMLLVSFPHVRNCDIRSVPTLGTVVPGWWNSLFSSDNRQILLLIKVVTVIDSISHVSWLMCWQDVFHNWTRSPQFWISGRSMLFLLLSVFPGFLLNVLHTLFLSQAYFVHVLRKQNPQICSGNDLFFLLLGPIHNRVISEFLSWFRIRIHSVVWNAKRGPLCLRLAKTRKMNGASSKDGSFLRNKPEQVVTGSSKRMFVCWIEPYVRPISLGIVT